MDSQLKFTLIIGWLSGSLPIKNLRDFQCSRTHPIFFYTIFLLILYLTYESVVISGHREQALKMRLSQAIMTFLININSFVGSVSLRFWQLFRVSQISELIVQVVRLKKGVTLPKGSYILRYYFLGYLILLLDCIPWGYGIFQFLFEYDDLTRVKKTELRFNFLDTLLGNSGTMGSVWAAFVVRTSLQILATLLTRYFALAFVIFIGVNLLHVFENFCNDLQKLYCPEAVGNVHIIEDDLEEFQEEEDNDSPLADPVDGMINRRGKKNGKRNDKKKKNGGNRMNVSDHIIRGEYPDFPTDMLQANYWGNSFYGGGIRGWDSKGNKKMAVLQGHGDLWARNVIPGGAGETSVFPNYSLKDLSDRFSSIQKTFDDYNRVAGTLFFCLISQATVSLIHKLYSIASSEFAMVTDPAEVTRFVLKSVVGFMVVSGLSHLGEIIATRMRKWKEQLKCVMLTELLCEKTHDATNTLTESIVKWEWNLNAMNLFNINHSLLPAIAGTMVTYLIVIIQLKVSENTGPQNGTGAVVTVVEE